jgi:wyosine [tRNA(Phe)-imidazoG37] synthetase (radical SAM superfamily)
VKYKGGTNGKTKHIFGPVPSRRLGFSLGVDLVPFKTCTVDCIYCQLGKTTCKTVERKEYVASSEVLADLAEVLTSSKLIDYITLSGSGEPTLNAKTGEIIRGIKEMTGIPVAVLTNGTLLADRVLREDLVPADLVVPSLDAATQRVFEKVNRPHPSLKVESIIEGMVEFREMYEGEIWLEIMLVEGVNDSHEELEALRKAAQKIKPDKIQLNTPVRPPQEEFVKVLSSERLIEIKEFFGDNCEIIAEFERKEQKAYLEDVENEILTLISRRPVTSGDISSSLGLHINEVVKYVESLQKDKKITSRIHQGKRYFTKK